MSMQAPYGGQEREIDVAKLVHELWGYKWLLALMIAAGLIVGTFYARRLPAEYLSEALIQVEGSKQGPAAQLLAGGRSGDSSAAQIVLLKSRFILEPVVDELRLNITTTQQFTSTMERIFSWKYKRDINILAFQVPSKALNQAFQIVVEKPNEIALYNAEKKLVLTGKMGALLTNKKKTIQLKVKEAQLPVGTRFNIVKRPDAVAAHSLSNRLSIGESSASKQGTGILTVSLVGNKRTEVPKILTTILETARLKDAQRKSEEAEQTIGFLEHQLPIAKNLLEQSEKAYNDYRAKTGNIDISFYSEHLLRQFAAIDSKLNELELKEDEMKQQYTKVNPVWITFLKQIATLKKQRAKLELSIKELPASDQISVHLLRDIKVKESLYTLLLNKYQELQVIKGGTLSGVHFLAKATIPNGPMPTKARFFKIAGGLCGGMLGILFILIRKFLSPLVDDPQWTERNLSLPNVAIVPYSKIQLQSSALTLSGTKNTLLLLAHFYPQNTVIEALRSLRTTLQVALSCADNNLVSILGIAPGVGKSFITSNLAYLLAAAGKRVLLIDTDLRKGTAHKYFGIKPSPGLADVLLQEMDVKDVLQKTDLQENLTVLPRGHYPKNPSELLMKQQFKTIIQTCSKEYDVVLFDTPPILLVTDAILTAALSATNFLVMGAGVHQPHDVELAFNRLKHADISVEGSIFNFHKGQTRNQYYGKYYNYSYYYADDEKNV
ncbi:MAG: polysaccharide biosynthesis tyrosine autokinase [Gammaproteobacteria bacterium]|nr:polysaccharide biosynthesis tyrosine autokinase [Gammaproteobacteria bacterium]